MFCNFERKMTAEEMQRKEDKVIENGLLQFRKYDSYLRESLQNNKIIFGAAKNFNDPWDCDLPINIPNPEKEIFEFLKQANEEDNNRKSLSELKNRSSHYSQSRDKLARQLREEVNSNRRFTCFNIYSEKQIFSNSLFWANYADKHFGICMKFKGEIIDTKNSFFCHNGEFVSPLPVDYSENIPEFNYIRYRLGYENKNPVQYYFGTKSTEWKHENEIRFIYENENYNTNTEEYPQVRFNTSLLEKVYIGCNLQVPESEFLINSILSTEEYEHVKISRMIKSTESFQLLEQKVR